LIGSAGFPRHRQAVLFCVAALAAGLAGCATVAPPAPLKKPVPEWGAAQLIGSLKQRNESFRTLRALAQVDYTGPEGRHGFQEAVIVQRPDRLRLDTLTILGAILIFTANPNEMIGYHPREGVFVRAAPTPENLRRYTQIPLGLPQATTLLMGLQTGATCYVSNRTSRCRPDGSVTTARESSS
jgi:hypothetical protein